VAQVNGVGQILQVKAVPGDGVHAEVIGYAASRDDQVVVGHGARMSIFADPDRARRDVDIRHLPHQQLNVGGAAKDAAYRIGDLFGFEAAGGHLIEQWREEVVVLAVDEDDVYGLVLESAGGIQPAKSGADDDDSGPCRFLAHATASVMQLT